MTSNEIYGSTVRQADPGAFPRNLGWVVGVGVRLLVVAVIGFAYGFATNQIPAPEHFGPMWVSSLAAPYAVLAFLAGAGAFPSWAGAIAAGVVAEYAVFEGWYFEIAYENHFPLGVMLRPVPTWTPFQILTGVTFGILGWLWWRRNVGWAGAVCAAVFTLEAVVLATGFATWVFTQLPQLNIGGSRYPWSAWNFTVWGLEFCFGVLAAVLAVRVARHRARIQSRASS